MPELVEVRTSDKIEIRDRYLDRLEVREGLQGPPGAAGSAPQAFTYEQAAPVASLQIVHSLGFYPNVTVVEIGTGILIDTDVSYNSINDLTLTFATPTSFTAYLS